MSLELLITSALLGVGLAMDAFSVSLANGLADRNMKIGRMFVIAGTFAGFQFAMPMIGWVFIHTAESKLEWFSTLVPWIALLLLLYIGGKMLKEGIEERNLPDGELAPHRASTKDVLVQGVATSIDALSVGFAIAEYGFIEANTAGLIIAAVTFVICIGGVMIGRKAGTRLSWKASVLGGCILIAIGLEIFLKGML